jgi:mannan endo-1,4-beta-mannosidase
MCPSNFRKLILAILSILIMSLCVAPAVFSQATPPAQQPPQPKPPQGVASPFPVGPPPDRVQPPAYQCEPVNPNATPEARALLKRLCDLSGKGILTGHHNFPNNLSQHSDKIFEITGKYPSVWGSDFGFLDGEDKDSIIHRDLMIEEAKKQAAAGSIITLCWHMLRPTEDEPGKAGENGRPSPSWSGSVQARLADEQWLELIASDSPLHQRWEKYMDTAAAFLKQLQDANVPVLWRPMHENNGGFFWWGGRPGTYGTQHLYRELYNRMVNVHHLNNLIWVWSQNGPAPGGEFYDYFPGQQYVDVVSYDNYRELSDRYYHELLTIANGKPISLGEVGSPPSAEVLRSQPKWVWFMTWAGMEGFQSGRTKDAYNNPYFISRGDPLPAN